MSGTKIYHGKFRTVETIKLLHILFPRSSWPVRFNSSDIHSHQIINLLKSRLSPVWAYARFCND